MNEIKLKVWIATNKVGSRCETTISIPKREWERMNDLERDREVFEILSNVGLYEWSFEEIE